MTRLAILAVAATLLLSVLGIIALAVLERSIPDPLPQVTFASLTGLVGLLVNPRADRQLELEQGTD